MDLRESDIRVIRNLVGGPKKSKDVAKALNLSSGRVSQIISNLIKKGFVEKKNGKYYLSTAPHAEAIRLIIQKHPALSIEKILTKTEFHILSSLYGNRRSIKEIANHVGVTERTVYYKLDDFKTMGLVREVKDGQYGLNKRHDAWADLSKLLSGKIIQTLPLFLDDKDSWYAWTGKQKFIIKTTKPDKLFPYLEKEGYHWKYTSTSVLTDYGIGLTPRDTTLYVFKIPEEIKTDLGDKVSVEDAIIHLFLEKNKKADEYAKSLIQLNDEKINYFYLDDRARKHGVHEQVKNVQYGLKPFDIIRYNKDRFKILFIKLNNGEDLDFSIAGELDNYWKWLESFEKGENLDKEDEVIRVVEYATSLDPPLFKPLKTRFKGVQEFHEACSIAAKQLEDNAIFSFDKGGYWTSHWCYKKSIECYQRVEKNKIKSVLVEIIEKVQSHDFPINHKLDLIGLVVDKLRRLDLDDKKSLLTLLLKLSDEQYKLSIDKKSKKFITGFIFQRRALEYALTVAEKLNFNDAKKQFQIQLGLSHEAEGDLKGIPLVSTSHYEDALKNFKQAGDKESQKRIKRKLERLTPDIKWKTVQSPPIEIDFKAFDEGVDDLLSRPAKKILMEISSSDFIPSWSVAEKVAKEIRQESPIQFLLSHSHVRDGLPVGKDKGEDEILNSQIETQFMLDSQLRGLHLDRLLEHIVQREVIKPKDVRDFLELHKIESSNAMMVSNAYERHMNRDYISSINILVGQIESLLRQKLKQKGEITTRSIPNSDAGLQEATLGVLLEGELRAETEKLLGKDMTKYLQVFLINKKTGNLRNKIAHGLMKPEDYTKDKSTRLLQILLYIANAK